MSTTIPSPQGLGVLDWASQVTDALAQFGVLGRLQKESDWRDWGVTLLGPVSLGGYVLADPYKFDRWQDWADAVYKELS